MRVTLTLVAFLVALMFGLMTLVDGMQTVSAGGDDDDFQPCRNDDGDDDLEHGEPVDNPDSEDGEGDPVDHNTEDKDPFYELDDCHSRLDCGDMTAPGLYLFTERDYGGICAHFFDGSYLINMDSCPYAPFICWNDIASSAKLVDRPGGVYFCLHEYFQGNCDFVGGDLPNFNMVPNEQCGEPTPICGMDNNMSSFVFGMYQPAVPGETVAPEGEILDTYEAADADCDGGVGVSDALTNLQYLSGFEAGCAGDWDGDSYGGDADCSGDVAAGDVTAILAAVAGGTQVGC